MKVLKMAAKYKHTQCKRFHQKFSFHEESLALCQALLWADKYSHQ